MVVKMLNGGTKFSLAFFGYRDTRYSVCKRLK